MKERPLRVGRLRHPKKLAGFGGDPMLRRAIARGNLYAEAGADLVMASGTRTLDEVATLAKGIKAGLVITPLRFDPAITIQDLSDAGVKIVLFSTEAILMTSKVLDSAFAHLQAHGTFGSFRAAGMTHAEYREVTGYQQELERAARLSVHPGDS